MAKSGGVVTTEFGKVHWMPKPTVMDRTGCDGMYVRKVSFADWMRAYLLARYAHLFGWRRFFIAHWWRLKLRIT